MNDKVKAVLDSIRLEGEPVANALLHFDGVADTFILYSPSSEGVGLAGDDIPLEYVERWDIDLYSKSNYLAVSKLIKQAFIDSGWVYLGRGSDTYDEPTQLHHRLLEFEKEVED